MHTIIGITVHGVASCMVGTMKDLANSYPEIINLNLSKCDN